VTSQCDDRDRLALGWYPHRGDTARQSIHLRWVRGGVVTIKARAAGSTPRGWEAWLQGSTPARRAAQYSAFRFGRASRLQLWGA
jgi:hypothetical protein